ncbi:MAG TPA: DUF1801 domain-containing protein [Vicinamibacterales bacterium]|nr:DUF1801 domain-containing protein [Vicinamibacterales bacterium]
MFQNSAKSVAEYIDSLPEDRRAVVRKVRSLVRQHLPRGYKEQIGWGAITYAVPLKALPDTYNGQPLCYAAIAAQKNSYTLYLMSVYGNPGQKKWLAGEFKKRGKKFDMGKSCLHFKSLDDLPLDVVGQVVAATPMDAYIAHYRESRKKTAKGK